MPEVTEKPLSPTLYANGFATQARSLCLLGGGGLLLGGLWRGDWPGLTLAALGGLLLYGGLRRASRPAAPARGVPLLEDPPRREIPLVATSPPALAPDEAPDPLPAPAVTASPPVTSSAPAPAPVRTETAWPAELTPQEHAQARVWAYLHALERGGGHVPPYDPDRAAEDFCRAAGRVLSLRQGD